MKRTHRTTAFTVAPTRRALRLAAAGLMWSALLAGFASPAFGQRLPRTPQPTEERPRDSRETGGGVHATTPDVSESIRNPVAWQAALDRAGFSPGIIDGDIGRKTRTALRAYQAFAELPVTGSCDEATRRSLTLDDHPALTRYTLTPADGRLIRPPPAGWIERSKAGFLGYPSLKALAAERGHCTRALLARLNPGVNLDCLVVGDTVTVPNVTDGARAIRAASVEIDLEERILRAKDAQGNTTALFHCSIARDKAKRRTGVCTVRAVAFDPAYRFDPADWPEVRGVDRVLTIPPGPRNPVGLCWIGLSRKGYGIHGTPEPELIGKTGSHGCIRLTNWDAVRLARAVRVGMEVRFK